MVARPQESVQGEIETVGGVKREDDPLRALGSEQSGGPLAAPLDDGVNLHRRAGGASTSAVPNCRWALSTAS